MHSVLFEKNKMSPDLTVVLTLLDCAKTHSLSRKVTMHDTLHIGLTDIGCKRGGQEPSVLIPVVGPGTGLVQLLADLR